MRRSDPESLTDVADELCEQHPNFRRITIERLLSRTAQALRDEGGRPTVWAIRETARKQLDYLDGTSGA